MGKPPKKKKTRSLAGTFTVLTAVIVCAILVILFAVLYVGGLRCGIPAQALRRTAVLYLIIGAALLCAAVFFFFCAVKKRILEPIRSIEETAMHYSGDLSDGNIDDFYFGHLNLGTGDEFEELTTILSGMERDIAESGRKLMLATAEKQRISTELTVANDIQENMLPNLFPPFPDRKEFDIYATMDPAKEIGGDFFDFFLIDPEHLGIVMADVSGKGIPAALFMMSSMIVIDNYAGLGYSPSKVLELSNDTICSMKLANMFVTVWFGVLNLATGVVTAANAGHEYPAVRRAGGDYELLKERHGFVVGGMENIRYKEYSFRLQPGDALFLYTDGVPEATDPEGHFYGCGRMLDALNRAGDLPPKELLESVRADVDRFVSSAPQFDDLTMLSIKYYGKTERS